jgi:hypothetical protein
MKSYSGRVDGTAIRRCAQTANNSLELPNVRTSTASAAYHSPDSIFIRAMTTDRLVQSKIAQCVDAAQLQAAIALG